MVPFISRLKLPLAAAAITLGLGLGLSNGNSLVVGAVPAFADEVVVTSDVEAAHHNDEHSKKIKPPRHKDDPCYPFVCVPSP